VDYDDLLNTQHKQNEEETGADKWTPEAGTVLSGAIQKTGWYDGGDYKPSMFLVFKEFETDDTYRVYMPTVLHKQMLEAMPAIGQHIVIRYEGMEKGASGREYKNYTTVLVPDENGNVKRDHQYWAKAAVYRPTQQQANRPAVEETDFF